MVCEEYALTVFFLAHSIANRATDGICKMPSEEFDTIPNQQSQRTNICGMVYNEYVLTIVVGFLLLAHSIV